MALYTGNFFEYVKYRGFLVTGCIIHINFFSGGFKIHEFVLLATNANTTVYLNITRPVLLPSTVPSPPTRTLFTVLWTGMSKFILFSDFCGSIVEKKNEKHFFAIKYPQHI